MQTFLHYRWRVPSTLHRLHPRRIIPLLLLALCVTGAKAQTNVKFNGDIRYSQWVIDSRMNDFYANTTPCGFAVYDQSGTQTSGRKDGKTSLDYVVGLVAKSIIEASQYYSQYTWAQSFAKPWFLSIQNYGDYFYNRFRSTSGSLDDLNAVKLFIPLRALTESKGKYPDATTYANTATALNTALSGLGTHNSSYSIKSGTTAETAGKTVAGGWWHKQDYKDQMWLDGSYMGPALFAELVNYSGTTNNIDTTDDWDLIVKQFTILRSMCWNETDKLLYHAFAADGGTNSTSHSDTWAGLSSKDPYVFHSETYWGRAVGWYFLALVDVLEQMEKANISSSDTKFTTLKGYLTETAEGLKARQDASGGWYQILDKNSTYSASEYNDGKKHSATSNYIESSATALFTAAYLKAIRKGYLDGTTYKTVAEDGYKCLVNNFFSVDENGKVNIFGSCRSAGLGGKGDEYTAGKLKYRNGSKEYYLLGNDVARVDKSENETEGKVLGAFIMAATEYERAPENQKAIRFSYDLAPSYTLAQGGSITAEALGSGTITYKWYKSDGTEVSDAKSETFYPKESGTYYCKATSGSTTIQTSTTEVTVEGTDGIENGGTETKKDIFSLTVTYNQVYDLASDQDLDLTSDYASVTGGTALVHNGKDKSASIIESGNINLNGSGGSYAKLTLNTPLQVGDVITFTSDDNSIGSFYLTSSVTKNENCPVTSGTYTITATDELAAANNIYVWKITNGKFKSITITRAVSITTQPTGATYDVNAANVNELKFEVSATGVKEFSYQWYSNTTNSTVGGREITTNGKSNTYTPVVTTAGTTYYYCIATAGVLSVTSDVVAVAVLNPSDLKTKYNAAWTPIANGTIEVGNLVTSSSNGAYSITSEGNVATIEGTTIKALTSGTFTLSQAADDKYKAGSIVITVRIGTDVTSNGTNEYSFTAQTTDVSDGMTIARKDITMTFGNDGFWSKPSANSYTSGQVTPVVTSNIPTKGTFYKFTPTTTGKLAVKVKLGTDGGGKLRPLYVSENGTFITAKLEDGTQVGKGETPAAAEAYNNKSVTFPVKANTDYYVYVTGSKLGFFGFTFEPATLYTVTFNAGTNGTCSTTSLMQESEGANITLPSVTPKTGYKFDGWYTAATGGEKKGGAGATYTPNDNTTLYARYTSTVSTSVVATFENPTKPTWYEKDKNGFTINGVSNIKNGGVKLSSDGSITLTIPEGYTVTGFDFTLLCANTTVGSTLSVGDDGITVKDGTHTLHHMNLSSSVTGPTTLTITNSGAKELNIKSIKVYGSNGKSISFTTHPLDAEYVKDATSVTALTVAAKVNNVTGNAPSIIYQWFWNSTKSTDGGTEISGQESSTSCTPDVSNAGTKYYYCKATATVDGEALEAYSNIATVTVSNPTLTIVTQPVGATYAKGQDGVVPLMVEAKTNTGSTITYQWYKNSSETTVGATKITDVESDKYTPPVTEKGTTYYYCVVTSGTLTETTKIVAITVKENVQPIYGYKVSKAGLTAPVINTSKYITTTSDESGDTGEKLVKMTFGGWKWKNGTYTKPGSDTQITDSWKDSETVSGVTVLDGYQYWFSGTQDAKQENKDAETKMYGQIRNGWFVSPTRENGITTDSHPYTLPVRGSFMTFEPTKNGTLTIYILQNGAWNTFDKDTQLDGVSYKKGAIKPGEFRMHAFQITNQRGLVLAEFAPNYSVTNNQKVQDGYTCTEYLTRPSSFDKTSTDVSKWEEFWTLSETERKAVHDNWSDAENNGCQKIIKLENGSFLAIQKAVVKYQFHVTGNETYYFFSNFSKMGFSGATFQPDADSGQPTDDTTFSGVNNSLSDTKPYTKITPTADGEIEGTGLTKYKYTINGTDIKLVDGVFIPQFKAITLNRTFKPKQWTTLTLPFNLTQTEVEQIFGKGTQILVFQDAKTEGTKLHIKFFYHEIQNILPGYPYLIRPTLVKDDQETPMESIVTSKDNAPIYTIDESGNLTSFTVYDKAINPHITQHEFVSADKKYVAKGTPDYCTQAVNGEFCKQYGEGDLFISDGNGKLYISKGSSYGKGYRSYIDYIGTETSSASTKTLSLTFSGVEDGEDDGTTTEISVAELADDVIEAFGIKGVYNLNGQKVAETTRNLPAGIYVVNGRKVVVK